MNIVPGNLFTVLLTSIAYGGAAVGRVGNLVFFVEGGIPGESVIAEVTEVKKGYINAVVRKVNKDNSNRVKPLCGHFGKCGGCQWQHIDYSLQLKLKTQIIIEQLGRIAGLKNIKINETLSSPRPWRYRYSARLRQEKNCVLGFRERRSHKVVKIKECPILAEVIESEIVTNNSTEFFPNAESTYRKEKILRTYIGSQKTSDTLVIKLSGRSLVVSRDSFVQGNLLVLPKLVALVINFAGTVRNRVVIDGYAGVGVFSVGLAKLGAKVFLIESNKHACHDAEINLADFSQTTICFGKFEQYMPIIGNDADIIIVDPPRRGLSRQGIQAIIGSTAKVLIYVSCNPSSFSRDSKLLNSYFRIESVSPVDMFPQTAHIELVAKMTR